MKDSTNFKVYRLKAKAQEVASSPLTRGLAGAASIAVGVVGFLVHYTFEWHGIDVNLPMLGGLAMIGVGGGLVSDAVKSTRDRRLKSKTLE